MSILSSGLLNEACESLELVTGILMTESQMAQFVSGTNVEKSINEYSEVDTQDRGNLADMLSQKLLGKSWPQYSDKVDMEKFALDINEKARELGYSVTS